MTKEFYKHMLLPIYYFMNNNNVLCRLDALEKSQFFELNKIKEIQFQLLKNILIHSYNNVLFYKKRFDAVNFNPNKFEDVADLNRIPYLTKTDIQNNTKQLIARNYDIKQLVADASGGSTGRPTNYYKDLNRHKIRRADQFRHDRWSGWDLGEKYVALWGAQREFHSKTPVKTKIIERYINRVFMFNAFDISEQKVLEYIEELKQIRPTMILAYANVAYLFAKIIHSHNIDLSLLNIKGLISSAETLVNERRNIIESAFCCKVLNRYGSREVGLIASECKAQEGLHINSENVFLEIKNKEMEVKSGERGEVIVTDLWNYGMPIIRYQLGDVATRCDQQCSCGRGLPLLKEVTGRVSDFIVDAKGGLIHGEYFTHLFYGIENIEQFQLIQEDIGNITLKILPKKNFNPLTLDLVIENIKLCIGGKVKVSVIFYNESFVEASGKFRFTISKISVNYFKNAN